MSKKDRIFRVLSIVLLMTMLLFSFGCAGQESLSEINSSAISSDVSDVSENPSVSSTETEGTSTETPSSNSNEYHSHDAKCESGCGDTGFNGTDLKTIRQHEQQE